MTNYVDTEPRPAEPQTGVVARPSCGALGCWVVLVNGVLVYHGTEAEALVRQGREAQRLAVT